MAGERKLPAVSSVAVCMVLDDDNLLIEILLRLGFPTTLVRAALVCRRWLHHVSDPAFLRHFCKLHPPRLIGFYRGAEFFPVTPPYPPELADVIRRVASYALYGGMLDDGIWIKDFRDGHLFTKGIGARGVTLRVHRPLCTKRRMSIVPPFPQRDNIYSIDDTRDAVLSKEEGNTLSYLYVSMEYTMRTKYFNVRVYVLRDDVWRMHTLAMTKISSPQYCGKPMLANNKIYFFVNDKSDWSGVLLLDLSTTSFSRIQFPQGVKYDSLNTKLSRADDASSVYLIELKEFQLRIWLCKGDNWSLLDTICLHDMVANLRMPDRVIDDEQNPPIWIREVGDNAEFMFLMMGECLLYLDTKCRTLRIWSEYAPSGPIHPFMMIWPPKFPVLKDDPTRFVFCPSDDLYSALLLAEVT